MIKKAKLFLEMIKFEHSVFALPFAYLGMVLASDGLPSLKIFIAVTFAMVSARTFGMALNRIIDRQIDARNPRTQGRALPKGDLDLGSAWTAAVLSLLIFAGTVCFLPAICWILAPPALFMMWVYPYLKRFTSFSHFFLGLVLGSAPVGGWIAVTGEFALTPILLALGVIFWVAGFDILYSLQDYRFDRKNHLFSLAVRWGRPRAIQASQCFHLFTVLIFGTVLYSNHAGLWAWAGLLISAGIMIHAHRLIADHGLGKIEEAFFVSNACVSIVFFAGVLLDLVI